MTFNFADEMYVNSVLLVQNSPDSILGEEPVESLLEYYAAQWDIHIGNNPDWRKNPKCNSEPHLDSSFRDHWSLITLKSPEKYVPAYGFDDWCNMSGKYVTFVAQ